MRLVSITRVLDEADIIESFVRHTATYASKLIFIDNGSRDGTLEILSGLRREGIDLVVYQNKSVSFQELCFNTTMFRDAVDLHGADWVLCLDADEFIDDKRVNGGLVGALQRCQTNEREALCLGVQVYEYRQSATDDVNEVNVALRLRHRLEPFGVQKVFLSKALAALDPVIGGGNHCVYVGGERVPVEEEPGLRLAHFPERSPYQISAKWIKGWAKVLASGPTAVKLDISSHYREPFEVFCDTPELLLREPNFIGMREHRPMVEDPLDYRGGGLVFTKTIDEQMRAVRMIVGYFEELATRYGYLIERCAEAAAIVKDWDDRLTLVIGDDHEDAPTSDVSEHPSSADRRLDSYDVLQTAAIPYFAKTVLRSREDVEAGEENLRPQRNLRQALARSLRRRLGVGLRSWRMQVLETASAAVAEHRFTQADELLAAALFELPEDASLLKQYALSAHNSGRYRAAVDRWRTALCAAPRDPMCHAGVASNLRELGKLGHAAEAIEVALSRFPSDGTVLTEAARIAAARLCFNEALVLLERAIGLFGPLAELQTHREHVLAELAATSLRWRTNP